MARSDKGSGGARAPRHELFLAKADFKFAAAHFCSHGVGGARERLHGHNYAENGDPGDTSPVDFRGFESISRRRLT